MRILRRLESYSMFRLGAFGTDLGVLTCFFEEPWSRVSQSLTEADQAFVLNCAGSCLYSLGRLHEATGPLRDSTHSWLRLQNWQAAAGTGTTLNAATLALGHIGAAVSDAECFVAIADRGGDDYLKMYGRPALGNALLHAGQFGEAERRFREAEEMQRLGQPQFPFLYWLQGFQYCDLLLASAERAAWRRMLSAGPASREDAGAPADPSALEACLKVVERATQTLNWALTELKNGPLYPALDRLTLFRAAFYPAVLEGAAIDNTTFNIDEAVAGLRSAGRQETIPIGLLGRAWLRALSGDMHGAQTDLDEAWEIAERGPMQLHIADIHLHRARLFFRETSYPWKSPRLDLASARELVERCGYWRRKDELEDAEAFIVNS